MSHLGIRWKRDLSPDQCLKAIPCFDRFTAAPPPIPPKFPPFRFQGCPSSYNGQFFVYPSFLLCQVKFEGSAFGLHELDVGRVIGQGFEVLRGMDARIPQTLLRRPAEEIDRGLLVMKVEPVVSSRTAVWRVSVAMARRSLEPWGNVPDSSESGTCPHSCVPHFAQKPLSEGFSKRHLGHCMTRGPFLKD